MSQLPSPSKAVKYAAVWLASNLTWTLVSGAVGASVSSIVRANGVFDNPYGLVAIGLLVTALIASIPSAKKRASALLSRSGTRRPATFPPLLLSFQSQAQSDDKKPDIQKLRHQAIDRALAHSKREDAAISRHIAAYHADPLPTEATEPLTHLEQWLQERGRAASTVARQRAVRGDKWYFRNMAEWDNKNTFELMLGKAPELVDSYRADVRSPEQVDGVGPSHDTKEQERYYAQRLAWLEHVRPAPRWYVRFGYQA
ncbi:MAG: hypothetical protein WBV85_13320 [Solirubrobacteraceae bacterium]